MKVFISWSGKLSESVATLLKEWLPLAVPGTECWLSKTDIEKGSIWFPDIQTAINETSVGIICLTRENLNRPWILFEAGALNKGLSKSRVCPLLLDLEDKELEPPLKDFNNAKPQKDDMFKLCAMINGFNKPSKDEIQLKEFFNAFWPRLESGLREAMENANKSAPPIKKAMPEMMQEVLETVHALLRIAQSGPSRPVTPTYALIDPKDSFLTPEEFHRMMAGKVLTAPIASLQGINSGQGTLEKFALRATPDGPKISSVSPTPPDS